MEQVCVSCNDFIEDADICFCEWCGEGPFCEECLEDHDEDCEGDLE